MNYFQKYLVDEFLEDYSEGRLSRRQALKMIGGVIGNLTMASVLLAACTPAPEPTPTTGAQAGPTQTAAPTDMPSPTSTPQATATTGATATTMATGAATAQSSATPGAGVNIPEDDPDIQAGMMDFPSESVKVMAYLAHPVGDERYPAVLVCHENRGLTDYVKDVARRLAKAGYVALAVDLLSRNGGTAAITDATQVPGILSQAPTTQFVQDFKAGWSYLQSQSYVRPDGVGMVGFCFGGGVTWLVAAQLTDLKAAVPYYGPLPPAQDVAGIKAAMLGIYAGNDTRVNQGIEPVQKAMQQNNQTFEQIIYPDTDHAFHNDTGTRYNATAAQDAWSRTLAWFAKYLGES
jgi:carboxymethylenebutenolidase